MLKKLSCLLVSVLVIFGGFIGVMETSVEAEQVEITIAAGSVGDELEETERLAELYMEENPDVQVNVLDTPDLADDRLGLYQQFLEDESPYVDVYQIDVIWPGDLAVHFVDLYDYGADEVIDKHFDSIVENNTVDGKLVGLPWFTDAGLLYYREDLLEKYGFEEPSTWEELERAAMTIMRGEQANGNDNFAGYVWQGDAYEGLTCNALEWIDSHNGGQIIEPDGTVTINNSNTVQALERAADWIGDISPQGTTDMTEEDAREIFQAGNAAFMRNWPYAYSLAQADDSPIQDKVGVAPVPAGPDGEQSGTLGGWQLSVSRYSEHPEVAADVALFMASPEQQKRRAIESSYNPTIKELYEDEDVLESSPFMGELYDVFVNAVPRPSTVAAPHYNDVSREFYTEVYSVLTGQTESQIAAERLETALEELGFKAAETSESETDYIYYTIQSGDTLVQIANQHGTSLQAVLNLNDDKIDDPAIIYPGQELKIPQ